MEYQEIPTSLKRPVEKPNFLARLRQSKGMSLILAGGILFGSETSAATPNAELKKVATLLKLMQDSTIKSQEMRVAMETFLDLPGAKQEALFQILHKPEADNEDRELIVNVLRGQIIKKVEKGEESAKALKMYLDVLRDKKSSSDSLARAMEIVGWLCVSDKNISLGWGQDQEGKSFIIKGKNTPAVLHHVDGDTVFPLIIDKLGHAEETVRQSARHELIGIILFADKDGKTLEEVRRLASDNSNELKQKESQGIIDFIDQLNRTTEAHPVKEPQKEESQPPNEYDKWIKILKDKESKLHWEAFQELLKLGGGEAINALAELAAQESWARLGLSDAISSQNIGEEYKIKAEIAKAALIEGIGALLKTNPDQAITFLKHYPLYRQGGLGEYTGELMDAYYAEKSPFNREFIAQFLLEMPQEERDAAIQRTFRQLDINDPVRQTDTFDLLRNITQEDDEAKQEFYARAEVIALDVLSNFNNRSTLPPAVKEKLLHYLSDNDENSEVISNHLKSDPNPSVRRAAYDALIRSGNDEAIGEMIKDYDPTVREAGHFQVTRKAYQLKEKNQPYENEVKPLYDALRNETDEGVRAEAVSHLTILDLPADEALTDSSPRVRLRGVYNLQERVRKGDQNALSRLKQIAVDEREDGSVSVPAKAFVNNWEEWQRRKQEEQ